MRARIQTIVGIALLAAFPCSTARAQIVDPAPGPVYGQLFLRAFGTPGASAQVRVDLPSAPMGGGAVAQFVESDSGVPGGVQAQAWGPAFLTGVVANRGGLLVAAGPPIVVSPNLVVMPINSAPGTRVVIRMISASAAPLPAPPYMPGLIPPPPPVLPCCQIDPMPAAPAQVLGDPTYAWPSGFPGAGWPHLSAHYFAQPQELPAGPSAGVELESCGPVTSYCTAGSTSNNCSALMSATGIPSASQSSGFVLVCGNVEAQRTGLIFYGIAGPNSASWGPGSTSFLCVKPPVQRTPVQNSGGTAGACDGSFSIDFLAYCAAHPGALGTPFGGGTQVWTQAWFRDPPAPLTTNLSDGSTFWTCP